MLELKGKYNTAKVFTNNIEKKQLAKSLSYATKNLLKAAKYA